MLVGELCLDLLVADDAAFLQIDQQHLARLQAPLGDDLLFRNRQNAHFRRHHDETVVSHEIARRTQAVAIERRADLAAIGEGDRGRAVPRLHESGVILVEGAPSLVHQRIARPGLGDQHHHRMGERIAALHEELERIVEARRIRLAFVGDRPELGYVGAEQLGLDRRLARRHPVDVAAQRVDLAVVRDHAIGVGQTPGRERIGGEALVDERERADEARVRQILVIAAELADEHHALVDDRARRHRHRIIFGHGGFVQAVDRVRDRLARDEQAPLELVLVHRRAATDEHLPVRGLDLAHGFAEIGGIDGNLAPAEQRQRFGLERLGRDRLGALARRLVGGHEELADAVLAGLGQVEAELGAFLREERVRDLRENAAAVAELGIGADRAAVIEVHENAQAHLHDLMRLAILHVRDEADAAGVMLLGGIVETLRTGQMRVL